MVYSHFCDHISVCIPQVSILVSGDSAVSDAGYSSSEDYLLVLSGDSFFPMSRDPDHVVLDVT